MDDFFGGDRVGAAFGEGGEVFRRVDPHADDFVELALVGLLDDNAVLEGGKEVAVDVLGDGLNEFWDEDFDLDSGGAGDAYSFESHAGDAAPGDEADGGVGVAFDDEEILPFF